MPGEFYKSIRKARRVAESSRGFSKRREHQLSEAARLDPRNKDYMMRLAALRLGATDSTLRANGKKTLVEMQSDPALRREATRFLAEDALRQRLTLTALELARQLDSFPDKTFADRLLLLTALDAAALRELGNQPESASQWNEAVKKIAADPRQALSLAETVEKWGWRAEAIELLWLVAKDPVRGNDALRTLSNYFARNGDTENLYRVVLHQVDLHPDDANVQNNFAQLSLLLNLNTDRGQKAAREVYEKDPKNPAFVSTYAFALHAAGDSKKALKILETLSPEQLRKPEIAAYYGVILVAMGDQTRAGEFLDLGEKANLLPPEKALIEKARRSLAQR